jgi:hypothetical protein
MKAVSLHGLYLEELRDLHDADHPLIDQGIGGRLPGLQEFQFALTKSAGSSLSLPHSTLVDDVRQKSHKVQTEAI